MKRVIFLILLAVIGVAKVSAQEVDLSQENSKDARIEELSQEVKELSQKLEQLQEDYVFLDCSASLSEYEQELNILANEITISALGIENDLFHSSFDIEMYDAYCNNYDAREEQIKASEFAIDVVKARVESAISRYDFSYLHINVLNAKFNVLDKAIIEVKAALAYYETVIDLYKKKSKY